MIWVPTNQMYLGNPRSHFLTSSSLGPTCLYRQRPRAVPCRSSEEKTSVFVFSGLEKTRSYQAWPAISHGAAAHLEAVERRTSRAGRPGGVAGHLDQHLGRPDYQVRYDIFISCVIWVYHGFTISFKKNALTRWMPSSCRTSVIHTIKLSLRRVFAATLDF